MSDAAEREWRFYMEDMITFAQKVMTYTDGLDQTRFVSSGLNYDATIYATWSLSASRRRIIPMPCARQIHQKRLSRLASEPDRSPRQIILTALAHLTWLIFDWADLAVQPKWLRVRDVCSQGM
jgi:hypothetical protein